MNGGSVTALRWVAVLPAAVAGYVVSGLAFWLGAEGTRDALFQLASFCISPAVFVFCGARVAPAHRFGTAIVLTIIWAITSTALFTWSATARGYDDWLQTGRSLTWAILGVISTLVTAFAIHRSEKEDEYMKSFRKKKEAADTASSSPHEDAHEVVDDAPQVCDPYGTLGVRPGDSFDEIRRAYRERMKEYHPDKVAGLGKDLRELAERKAKEINIAFEQLRRMHGAG